MLALMNALDAYYKAGHIVNLNADVMTNRIGAQVFGEGVWKAILKRRNCRKCGGAGAYLTGGALVGCDCGFIEESQLHDTPGKDGRGWTHTSNSHSTEYWTGYSFRHAHMSDTIILSPECAKGVAK